jgi:hypothetical protein
MMTAGAGAFGRCSVISVQAAQDAGLTSPGGLRGEKPAKIPISPLKSLFFRHRIIAFLGQRIRASRRAINMARSQKPAKPAATAKTKRPVTLKHLAAALAEEHQLSKRAGEAILGDLVGTITKHLRYHHQASQEG